MKPISKSKRQLAQLLIEAGVTQFPEGANWAAQDRDGSKYPSEPLTVMFYNVIPTKPKKGVGYWFGECGTTDIVGKGVRLPTLIPNWHQTVLSRDEFDRIVAAEKLPEHVNCRCTVRSIPEPTTTPTLDQLLQDWRNADDYAQRKQTEADEAAAMRDERWQAVQARAGEMSVTVGRCEGIVAETELVADSIAWDDLSEGDEMLCVIPFGGAVNEGSAGRIRYKTENKIAVDFPEQRDYVYYKSHFDRGDVKFIRRP